LSTEQGWFFMNTRIEQISNEEGQALVEYAFILALITLFALGALQLAAGTIVDLIDYVASTITGVT
jgi:Flp pilus assembly pilin Flp